MKRRFDGCFRLIGLFTALLMFAPIGVASGGAGKRVLSSTKAGMSVNLQDAAGYRMWFRAYKGGDTSATYAEDVMSGRFRPREDVDYWQFKKPIDWKADPFSEDNWQFLLHSFYMLDPLLVMEDRTKERKYAEGMLEIVNDWYVFHIVDERSAKYSWYNMAVGMRSAKLAYLHAMLRARHPELLDDSQEQVFTRLAEHHVERVLSGQIPLRMTNHGLFQIHGVVALCREFPELASCSGVASFVSKWLPEVIDSQFDAEGIHLEHSPAYHRFTLAKLQTLKDSGWYDEVPQIAETIARAESNVFWLVDPANRYWGIGDSIPSEQPDAGLLALPANDCVPNSSKDVSVSFECIGIKEFSSGYVVVKTLPAVSLSNASGLFFQGAFHSSVHKHLDDQTFEWFEKGSRLIVDSGYYGYEKSPMRRYMQSTRAHNTVEIGARDFSRSDKYAYGSAIKDVSHSEDYVRIQGRVEHTALSSVHSRQLLYKPGAWLLVRDWISSSPARDYRQWFHIAPQARLLRQDGHSVAFSIGGVELAIQSLSGCFTRVIRGAKDPVYQGWYSPSQGVVVPNYAVAFECGHTGAPSEVALTLGGPNQDELLERVEGLKADNPFN